MGREIASKTILTNTLASQYLLHKQNMYNLCTQIKQLFPFFKGVHMPLKIYHYPKCSTCRKALKFLDANHIVYTAIDITEKPPTKTELKHMLKHQNGDLRKLFNTSGMQYRELKIKDKLPTMTEKEAIDLLAQNGKLIKRPFLLTEKTGFVGFKEDDWQTLAKT